MYQNFITRVPQRELKYLLFMFLGLLLYLYLSWQFDKWWSKKRKVARSSDEANREVHFLKKLQQRLGTSATVAYEVWDWPKLAAIDSMLIKTKFHPSQFFAESKSYHGRAVGYYFIEKKVGHDVLRAWCIPYGNFKINAMHIYAAFPLAHTPVRLHLQPDVLPFEEGHQLESRAFNRRYTLWGDRMLLTEVFDPHLMSELEKFSYLQVRSLYMGNHWFRAEADSHFSVDDIEYFLRVCSRLIVNYQKTMLSISEKPKGE